MSDEKLIEATPYICPVCNGKKYTEQVIKGGLIPCLKHADVLMSSDCSNCNKTGVIWRPKSNISDTGEGE